MVLDSFGDDSGPYSEEWHRKRDEARYDSYTLDEFSELDIIRYGLKDVQIDRKKKPSTFRLEPRRDDAEGSAQPVDIRTLKTVRD